MIFKTLAFLLLMVIAGVVLLSPVIQLFYSMRGEVPERLNGHDWKSCRLRKGSPGFESLPLRIFLHPRQFWRAGVLVFRSRDGQNP